jgi:hypothetical protein
MYICRGLGCRQLPRCLLLGVCVRESECMYAALPPAWRLRVCIYICICICVCVCVRVCVCICIVYVYVYVYKYNKNYRNSQGDEQHQTMTHTAPKCSRKNKIKITSIHKVTSSIKQRLTRRRGIMHIIHDAILKGARLQPASHVEEHHLYHHLKQIQKKKSRKSAARYISIITSGAGGPKTGIDESIVS